MAEATPKQHNGSSSNTSSVDFISDLPESLISHILSSMPTKDAVATSILSRSWRFRWAKVTSFEFDNNGSENQISGDFEYFVNMVLLNHSGESIEKFLLRWESSKYRSSSYLYTWTNIAIARKVRVLNLNTLGPQRKFHLPSLLYTSVILEALKLEGPFQIKPPNVVCLPKLTKMELIEVIYESDEVVHKLISGCPVLEALAIQRVHKRDNLVVCCISSPLLKFLHIYFHDKSKGGNSDMELNIDAPALELLSIMDCMSSNISIQQLLPSLKRVVFCAPRLAPNLTVGLMKTLSSVNCHLALYNDIGGATLPLKVSFERLVKLIIEHPQYWSSVMDLLDGCNVLEELGFSGFISGRDPWCNPGRVPRCLSSLRRITFGKFDGLKKEMAVLKFFLNHCLALERVDICCEGKWPDDEAKRLEILDKVSKLSRASPACKFACLEYSGIKEYLFDKSRILFWTR